MSVAKGMQGNYAKGYMMGLRRHFYGERFGTEIEHEQMLLLGLEGDVHVDFGHGYRDGFAGIPPASVDKVIKQQTAPVSMMGTVTKETHRHCRTLSRWWHTRGQAIKQVLRGQRGRRGQSTASEIVALLPSNDQADQPRII